MHPTGMPTLKKKKKKKMTFTAVTIASTVCHNLSRTATANVTRRKGHHCIYKMTFTAVTIASSVSEKIKYKNFSLVWGCGWVGGLCGLGG